jgi:hypothetical protein
VILRDSESFSKESMEGLRMYVGSDKANARRENAYLVGNMGGRPILYAKKGRMRPPRRGVAMRGKR